RRRAHAMDDYAIVVGISQYPGLRVPGGESADLQASERDAVAIRDWLVRTDGGGLKPENVTLITSSTVPKTDPATAQPEYRGVKKALRALAEKGVDAQTSEDRLPVGRRLYLYFSGHGFSPVLEQPAVFTADASYVAPEHVFVHAWFAWFRTAGYFQEFVLWVDC